MKIELNIEEFEDLTEEEKNSLRFYYANPINLIVKENGKKIVELNSTFHDAILIEILDILADFKDKKRRKRHLEAYDNAESYLFEREKDELIILNFDEYDEKQEWKKSIGFMEFKNAFVKEVLNYLEKLVNRFPEAISSESYSLMKDSLNKLV
ncbi:hypothetical protein [Peribacillus asahii]|uniref:Uncharacterized protein n=1 Tax=Peribacillus asahii TaxID=228899 RepID=A0A3T0KX61_9BACI|nr:hypothetical protein [Peribacillus asahii]AZV44858.1 hypothetical protein BAOM_4278 [Peribacillus asahii]USK84495.1 hypothetical protein LIT35_19180 [Peribacillus asahii]